MKIYGLEKLSMVDFEGHLCATVFTSGCNFRCPFCHNADLVNGTNLTEISEQEFFDFLKKRKGILDSVCVSGGEPTLWHDLPEFIKKIKDMGYLVKLDTNGTNPTMLKKLIGEKLIDYVAMDIKNSQSAYTKTAGNGKFDISTINTSVEILKSGAIPYEFRTTLIKGHHTENEIKNMAKWLTASDKLYLQCFVDSGNCITDGCEKIDKQTADKFRDILARNIKEVKLRGY